jgi:hypothetical protein
MVESFLIEQSTIWPEETWLVVLDLLTVPETLELRFEIEENIDKLLSSTDLRCGSTNVAAEAFSETTFLLS